MLKAFRGGRGGNPTGREGVSSDAGTPFLPVGFLPALVPCSDVEQQSAFVASRILELRDEGTDLEDIAVMYRSHYHSIELQLELSRRNIPYRIQSGVRFFEQAHIKDVISYLRVIVNPRDELAWKRILKMIPGIGNKTANRVFEALVICRRGDAGTRRRRDKNPGVSSVSPSPRRLIVPLRSSTSWRNFIVLLELLVTDENRNNPSKQIEIILTHGYEQYLQENFENADARIEDLKGLAAYANRYKSTEDLLSELALLSTERFKEPQPLVGEEVVEGGDEDELLTLTSVHQAKGPRVEGRLHHLGRRRQIPFAQIAPRDRQRRRGTPPLVRRHDACQRRTVSHISASHDRLQPPNGAAKTVPVHHRMPGSSLRDLESRRRSRRL